MLRKKTENTKKNFLSSVKSKFAALILLFYYAIGLIGLIVPITHNLFVELVPYSLLLSYVVVFFFHNKLNNKKLIIVFVLIYILSLMIEIIGVNYKFVFGEYIYGDSLGYKFLCVPILIGANWLFLIYSTSSIYNYFKINSTLKIVLASLTMVIYDFVLELNAPKLDMWYWKSNYPPIQNFVAWFLISIAFHSLIKLFNIDIKNEIAITLFIIQFIFFTILTEVPI